MGKRVEAQKNEAAASEENKAEEGSEDTAAAAAAEAETAKSNDSVDKDTTEYSDILDRYLENVAKNGDIM